MALSTQTIQEFSPECRRRGHHYFLSKRAKLLSHNSFLAEFSVRGAKVYKVNFDFKLGIRELDVHCSCPYFDVGNNCKHIWACLLMADKEKLFREAQALPYLKLQHHSPGQATVNRAPEYVDAEYSETPLQGETTLPPDPSPSWQSILAKAQEREERRGEGKKPGAFGNKTALFVVDVEKTKTTGQLCLQLFAREYSTPSGATQPLPLKYSSVIQLREPEDREIFKDILGRAEAIGDAYIQSHSNRVQIPTENRRAILARIHARKALFIGFNAFSSSKVRQFNDRLRFAPYAYDSAPWSLALQLGEVEKSYFLSSRISNGTSIKFVKDAVAIIDGLVLFEDFAAASDLEQFPDWIEFFDRRKELEIPASEIEFFLEQYFASAQAPHLELPENMRFENRSDIKPRVRLSISSIPRSTSLQCGIDFIYNDIVTDSQKSARELIDVKNRCRIQRDLSLEASALEQSQLLGGKDLVLDEKSFLPAIEKALSFGWEVIAHKKSIQAPMDYSVNVKSGIDWFDLNAEFNFENLNMSLPDLLRSVLARERFVPLGDGRLGLLPEEWLKKFGPLAEMAKATEEGLRFSKIQAILLSAALEETVNLQADRKFGTLKSVIDALKEARPREPSEGFHGKLRAYQKKGLAWLDVLAENEIGGILADDMGLGKTIQLLALLTARPSRKSRPSLVVAPKSLIFNWSKEAEKFTPGLKLLNFTGAKRAEWRGRLSEYDVILTTYQSLRMDIDFLKDIEFDHFILDEAQNIKNPSSQAAMACRLIQANKKFALTGTPVENSLGDLFSILSVVLPGLVSDKQSRKWIGENNPETLKLLSRALTPFILRRTKEQVLKDLPAKSEQVLYCELSGVEMRKYNELKAHYRDRLGEKLTEKGLARSKIEILEALLRLRQASCHLGLLDKKMRDKGSSKFEVLLDQVDSIIKDGHKALVFSQFTSLLALLKPELESRGIVYEYLDGKTQDREARVDNFQTNPDVKLFLLSLKAGGVGLNLTAADYVFILDPWWNPAVEAQAIDRTHRIGQTKKVLAYRLIAKGTVEEKILELQERKRSLANAIVSDETSILKSLKLEDLQNLFS